MHTHPPLLYALQDDGIRNSNSCRSPQLFHTVLFQHPLFALEMLEAAVTGPGSVNAGVEVSRDGLQSHFVEGKLHQGVYKRIE